MWTKIKTKAMNFFGFWTMAQIAGQYTGSDEYKKFWDDYQKEKNSRITVSIDLDHRLTAEEIRQKVLEALAYYRERHGGKYVD